jgi:uncharacterized protein YdeI (YjbR/CyaY-like superfamily)
MNNPLEMHVLHVRDREAWREWLAANHDTEPAGVWLVFYRRHTGKPTLEYEASVEEALCFGWVDSLVRKIDAERYARKFTPRSDDSRWSDSNRERAVRLIGEGLMTDAGLARINAARASGAWAAEPRPSADERMSAEFAAALRDNQPAGAFFGTLTAAQRRQFILWINVAKQPDTKRRRLAESIRLLEQGRKLGMV